jgi:hypothetical protein
MILLIIPPVFTLKDILAVILLHVHTLIQHVCANPGMPDCSWSKYIKTGKIYQMTTNYTELP